MPLILALEGTAHTFGCGLIKDGKILVNERDMFRPPAGAGIEPIKAAEHHRRLGGEIIAKTIAKGEEILKDELGGLSLLSKVDAIAYSAGPGLPPCLRATLEFAQKLAVQSGKPLLPTNHCIGHLEVARLVTGAKDPIFVYVSGGNTQIIGYAAGKYRVFGETMDIAIGNAIDMFIREVEGSFPGGPVLEKLALQGKNYLELPYTVKGMDLAFSGILTSAVKKAKECANLNDLSYSYQETIYAMLAEVAERAIAHTGKSECVLTGGVAASKRLNEMLRIMCEERGAKYFPCPLEYCGDNGVLIAAAAEVALKAGVRPIAPEKADFNSRWRTDDVDVVWY
jgi:N6-L-threonylcarbamoyladenine synthase